MANCGRTVRDSAMVTMESPWETTITLSNGAIADPHLTFNSPKIGSHSTRRPSSRRVLPRDEYDRRYRQDVFCIREPHQAMSPFAKLLRSLLGYPVLSQTDGDERRREGKGAR